MERTVRPTMHRTQEKKMEHLSSLWFVALCGFFPPSFFLEPPPVYENPLLRPRLVGVATGDDKKKRGRYVKKTRMVFAGLLVFFNDVLYF